MEAGKCLGLGVDSQGCISCYEPKIGRYVVRSFPLRVFKLDFLWELYNEIRPPACHPHRILGKKHSHSVPMKEHPSG